jgi:hypothetical protein
MFGCCVSSLGVEGAGRRAEAGVWAITVGGFPQWVRGEPTGVTLYGGFKVKRDSHSQGKVAR